MTNINHTPGPWSRNIPPAKKYCTIFAGRNTHVARVVGDSLPDGEVEANCNLIAAAPGLLAALEPLAVWAEHERRKHLAHDEENEAEYMGILADKARAAIAKARGL